MEKRINGNLMGNKVNVSINGILHSKDCGTVDEAEEMFNAILTAKEDPSDDNINVIYGFINKGIRIARNAGLEFDVSTGEIFVKGFNTPVPKLLVDTFDNYFDKGFPMESITNFWTLLMANPDVVVREDLFKFIKTHDFVLTDKGYMVVYKAVKTKKSNDNDLPSFVSNKYLHVKKSWFTSPKRYVVYKDIKTGDLNVTKKITFNKWDLDIKCVEEIGCLNELYENLESLNTEKTTMYTDMRTGSMNVQLGVPVKQQRGDCDADSRNECSNGLHVGATKYVTTFGGKNAPVLVCLVNPMNVIAVPQYDNSKMRVCEYYPFALASRDDDGVIDIVEQKFFETDYISHETEELDKLIESVKAEEVRDVSQHAEAEGRDKEEIMKILKTRVVDLTIV